MDPWFERSDVQDQR